MTGMNNRQLEIRDFILELARQHLGITNQQIDSLLNAYMYDTVRSITDIKTEIQTKMIEFSSHVATDQDSLFSIYGITDSTSLLEFIRDNREYGFLDFSSSIVTFPLGHLRGRASHNHIVTFDDRRVVGFLQDYYKQLPEYLKSDPISVSDMLRTATYSRLLCYGKLQTYQDTLKYMVATDIDIMELAASFFEEQGLLVQRYYFSPLQKGEGHFFLAYEQDHMWYYFEPTFSPFYGIHEFSSKEELEQVVFSKFLLYYSTSTSDSFVTLKDYGKEEKNLYQTYLSYQDRAIYDYRLSMMELDGSSELMELRKSSYEKWLQADSILKSLPRTLDFCSLRRVEKPKKDLTYREYLRFLYYQTKVQCYEKVSLRYQKEAFLLRLLSHGILEGGILSNQDGIYTFHGISTPPLFSVYDEVRRDKELFQLYKEHLFSLSYYRNHDSRVFYLDNHGDMIQVDGVDMLDIQSGKVEYPFENKDKLYALQIDGEHHLKFRGAKSYAFLRREKKLYEKLQASEILSFVPNRLISFPERFLVENRLPRNREDIYEYARRVGSISRVSSESLQDMKGLFPSGLEFGQLEGRIWQLFSFSDLRDYVKKQDSRAIQELFDFTLLLLKEKEMDDTNYQSYLLSVSSRLGSHFGMLLNQGYSVPFNDTIYEISLAGELQHILFEDYGRALNEVEDSSNEEQELLQVKVKYYFSMFMVLPILKVLTDAFSLISKRDLFKPVVNVFLGGFFEVLSPNGQDEFFTFYHELKNENLLSQVKKMLLSFYPFLLEEKDLMLYFLSIIDGVAMEKIDIVAVTRETLLDQKFLNQILTMKAEDRFVAYLEKQIARLRVPVSKLTSSMLCDHSKVGLLLQKEPIMVHTIFKLLTYHLPNKELFLSVAHDMIEYAECQDEDRKQELVERLEAYTQVTQEHNVVLEIKDETLTVSDMMPKQMTEAMGTSGVVTPHYLIFIFCGILFLAIGVVLAIVFM